jgi:PAS domain S-box-containing protein
MRVEQKILITIGTACTIVVAVALVAAAGTRRLVDDAEWVARTHDVRAQLQAISRHTNAAKADLRSYLLTSDSEFLRRHTRNVAAAQSAFIAARQLTTNDAAEEAHLAAMGPLLEQRERSFARSVALGPATAPIQGELAAQLSIGESLTRRIDSIIGVADRTEAMLLSERMRRERASELLLAFASLAMIVGATGLAVLLWRSIRRDLLGRERAEDALRASEAKFAGILEVAVDAIISIDTTGMIVHFNRGAREIFGYTPDEAIGRPLSLLLPERHQATHPAHVASFAAGAEAARRMGERRQIHGLRKNGEEFDAEASISKFETTDGLLFTAVVRDVTERKRREANEHALATASGELARSLDYETTLATVASLPVPAIGAWSILDIAEARDSAEPRLRRVASHHPDAVVDAALRALEADPSDWDSPEPFIDVFRTGEARVFDVISRDWIEAHCADERHVGLMTHLGVHALLVVPLMYRERMIGVWTIGSSAEHAFDEYDRTLASALAERAAMAIENARLLMRTREASESRDRVMSMVSHDLRNPLAAITMLARQLADEPLPPVKQRTIGTNILTSAQWMNGLMQDLLDVASIEAGRLSIEAEPQSVSSLVDGTVSMFEEQAAQKRLTLETAVPSRVSLVYADAHRIQQVLGNLIGNALKFTPAEGRVTITATQSDSEVTIQVRDTGPGIPASDLPRVFDRFWHARRGGAARGTGLGLAIVQGIVRAHGGRVWAESTVGDGSTFCFTLPVYRATGVATMGAPLPAPAMMKV